MAIETQFHKTLQNVMKQIIQPLKNFCQEIFAKKKFVLDKIAFFELLCVFSTKKKFEIFD